MLFEERQIKIREILEQQRSIRISELTKYLGISKVTARKHLKILSESIPITLVRGGAIVKKEGTSYEPNYSTKSIKNVEIKEKIGILAASLVCDGETLLLDSGSTTWHVANNLKGKIDITVITNDIKISMLLANTSGINTYFIGGKIRPFIFSSFGSIAEEFLKNFNVNKLFLGADAIDIEKDITNANAEEAKLKREMIRSTQEVILVTDNTKFNKVSLARTTDFSAIDCIITDKSMPKEYEKIFYESKVKLIYV